MKIHRPYKLVEYNPEWPSWFADKKQRIIGALGDLVLEIYHVGSTSIPGMIAKPQIDVLVVVDNLDALRENLAKMETARFSSRGNYTGIGEEYFTEDDAAGERLASIHVLPKGHQEIDNILAFRNHLLGNKEDRDLYIATKKYLYSLYADDYSKYDSGKESVIAEISKHIKSRKA